PGAPLGNRLAGGAVSRRGAAGGCKPPPQCPDAQAAERVALEHVCRNEKASPRRRPKRKSHEPAAHVAARMRSRLERGAARQPEARFVAAQLDAPDRARGAKERTHACAPEPEEDE